MWHRRLLASEVRRTEPPRTDSLAPGMSMTRKRTIKEREHRKLQISISSSASDSIVAAKAFYVCSNIAGVFAAFKQRALEPPRQIHFLAAEGACQTLAKKIERTQLILLLRFNLVIHVTQEQVQVATELGFFLPIE
jgi:hypothetical protein